jgi:hypothetical protein
MNWKLLLKLALSVLIIGLVLAAIDERMLWNTMQRAHPGWLGWALVWFVASKVMASYRFNAFLQTENIVLDTGQQLRLYWLGMYYNLLLPGGISGDGYKIKLLHDRDGASVKRLVAITLLERLSGAAALAQWGLGLGILGFWISDWGFRIGDFRLVLALLLALSVPVTWWLFRLTGGGVTALWGRSSLQSLVVQGAQLVAALGIIWSLDQGSLWLAYSILFLASSVAAMLPLTIGGTGARELTFLWGAQYLGADSEMAVAIAFLFYVVSTAVAFSGVAFGFDMGWLERKKAV